MYIQAYKHISNLLPTLHTRRIPLANIRKKRRNYRWGVLQYGIMTVQLVKTEIKIGLVASDSRIWRIRHSPKCLSISYEGRVARS